MAGKKNTVGSKAFPTEYTVTNALKKGNLVTKLSAVIFGLGNLVHGQIIKGLIFLAAEITYIIYMISFGLGQLSLLPSLGHIKDQQQIFNEETQLFEYVQPDNSMLILLYSVITLFLTAALILVLRASLKSAYEAQYRKANNMTIPSFKEDIAIAFDKKLHRTLLSLPCLGIVLFTIMPLVFMILMAFTDYDRTNKDNTFDWVGLINFKKVLDFGGEFGKTFWPVLGWTIIWAIFATLLNYIFGMILALTINRKDVKYKSFWRFCFILSVAIPQFVSLLAINQMLQSPNGALNVLLQDMGFLETPYQFFGSAQNPLSARVLVIIVNLWVGIPYTLLTTTGILQNIPAELYESAKVDGANPVVTFVKITLPYMLFVTAPSLIQSFIGNINNFNVIFLLTGGAPATSEYYKSTAGKTDLLVTWLYKLTIDNQDYSYGAVIGILVFIISITFSLTVYRRTGSYKNEEGFQ